MTGIRVSHHGSQVVDSRGEFFAFRGGLGARPPLLAVMEELSLEELGDFVGHGVGGVI